MNAVPQGNGVGESATVTALQPPERKLSFAFAKRHGIVVKQFVDGVAECACRERPSPLAIAEVQRYLRRSLRLERVSEED
jgi:hypothetical protein